MESDPVQACMTALQQAGWHVAPTASPWDVVTELHADRWWSAQLVDIAVLAMSTGLGLLQRVQITPPAAGAGPPHHQVLATTGLQPLTALPVGGGQLPPPTAPDAEAAEQHRHPTDQ